MRATNYVIGQLYSLEEIQELNETISKNVIDLGEDKSAKLSIKTSDVKNVRLSSIHQRLSKFIQFTHSANHNYFGFDLYPITIDIIVKHNSYKVGSEYSWHIDADTASTTRDFKLTGLINCSEKSYEGGDLFVFNRGIEFKCDEFRKTGSAIVFPSFYNHKVTPLISGDRKTLGMYFSGPKFR